MIVLTIYRLDNFDHPGWGLVVVGLLVGWTGVALWAYRSPRRRTAALLVADLAVAVAAMASTPLVKGDFNATVPGFWVAGGLLAWAIHWHTRGGLTAAVVLCAVDVAMRDQLDQGNYGNLLLLMIGGPIVGFLGRSLIEMAHQRDEAERAAAAAAERQRLARVVHDGVLQVLALVQRRGAAAGGEWAELGRLAAEQENGLRSLIRQQDAVTSADETDVDLSGALERLALSHRVRAHLVTPGGAVPMAAARANELLAVVGACLDNVEAHTGPDPEAWLLLEADPNTVVVSVRDEGPGIAEGRLAQAEQDGRLGVSSSIRGRVGDLGGDARLDTGSWGTEWEIEVPR